MTMTSDEKIEKITAMLEEHLEQNPTASSCGEVLLCAKLKDILFPPKPLGFIDQTNPPKVGTVFAMKGSKRRTIIRADRERIGCITEWIDDKGDCWRCDDCVVEWWNEHLAENVTAVILPVEDAEVAKLRAELAKAGENNRGLNEKIYKLQAATTKRVAACIGDEFMTCREKETALRERIAELEAALRPFAEVIGFERRRILVESDWIKAAEMLKVRRMRWRSPPNC